MGMAASQARYLALVARKSNCEYEGQQINQARTVLANQSANLFNQMLGLNVPIPPSTQDFTKTQYSYTDGVNASVIDSWKQLSNDPEYNYIVTSHYYTDRYTGSLKKMSDPQVQLSGNNPLATSIAPLAEIEAKQIALEAAKTAMDNAQKAMEDAVSKTKAAEAALTLLKTQAKATVGESFINSVKGAKNGDAYKVEDIATGEPSYDFTEIKDTAGYADNLTGLISYLKDKGSLAEDFAGTTVDDVKAGLTPAIVDPAINSYETLKTKLTTDAIIIPAEFPADATSYYTDIKNNLINLGIIDEGYTGKLYGTGDIGDPANYHVALEDDLENLYGVAEGNTQTSLPTYNYQALIDNGDKEKKDSLAYQINAAENSLKTCKELQKIAEKAYYDDSVNPPTGAKAVYDEALKEYDSTVKPTYIGNSELTLLTELTSDQETELKQVVSDMIANGVDTDIINCFNADGTYKGGVYTFKLNGVVYYTTYNNLDAAYASNLLSNNDIDAQYKMPYYNASYVSTRIEQEQKALLETDGNGRFSTVRFENDSVTYSLNVEQITDDAAYQDAMNQYNYENAKYDKMVQDINAQTSIIQQEDRQLELRLKQLDTEQNALKTEMEAVQKIVKDNVEDTFKTFSG